MTIGDETFKALPRTEAFFRIVKHLCKAGVSPEQIAEQVPWRNYIFLSVDGTLDADACAVKCKEVHGRKFDPKRFFCSTEELIHCGDTTYAFVSSWGSKLPKAIANITGAFADTGVLCGQTQQPKTGPG